MSENDLGDLLRSRLATEARGLSIYVDDSSGMWGKGGDWWAGVGVEGADTQQQ